MNTHESKRTPWKQLAHEIYLRLRQNPTPSPEELATMAASPSKYVRHVYATYRKAIQL
jgi:hypothetical protein